MWLHIGSGSQTAGNARIQRCILSERRTSDYSMTIVTTFDVTLKGQIEATPGVVPDSVTLRFTVPPPSQARRHPYINLIQPGILR
jgi:hypothetical protein